VSLRPPPMHRRYASAGASLRESCSDRFSLDENAG
jgi:hypothetical protein